METIVFYSYKGGTGRTLLLANFAQYLARCNKNVFVLDFDIEAPGMHYKFGLDKKDINRGLVDFIIKSQRRKTFIKTLKKDNYVYKVPYSNEYEYPIHFMPAGKAPSISYAQKVAQINWFKLFYSQSEYQISTNIKQGIAIFSNLKYLIKKEFDPHFLLIDSRTGISDIGGTAINILADKIVFLFLSNLENISGISSLIKSIIYFNQKNPNECKDIILTVTRIPPLNSHQEKQIIRDLTKKLHKELNYGAVNKNIKIPASIFVLRSEADLQINEEIRMITKKPVGESILLQDYLNFFKKIAPDIAQTSPFSDLLNYIPYHILLSKKDVTKVDVKILKNVKKRKNRMRIVSAIYVKGKAFEKFAEKVSSLIIEQTRTKKEPLEPTSVNLSHLATQMREGVFDFFEDPYYLTDSRKQLVDIVQFGRVASFTGYVKKGSSIHKALKKYQDISSFKDKMSRIYGQIKSLAIGVIGDHASAHETNRLLSEFIPVENLITGPNEENLFKWLRKTKTENTKMLICDHTEAAYLKEKASKIEYISYISFEGGNKELKFKYTTPVPVGFMFPKGDKDMRYEISKAISIVLSDYEKDIPWEGRLNNNVEEDLRKALIKPLKFEEMCRNIILELRLNEAVDWIKKVKENRKC